MPNKKRTGRRYQPKDWRAEALAQEAAAAPRPGPSPIPGKPGTSAPFSNGTLEFGPAATPKSTRPKRSDFRSDSPAPVHTPSPAPAAARPRIPRFGGGGKLVGAGVAGGVIGGSGAYALSRHNQRKAAMSKRMLNPFEEVVVFGKAYPVALPVGRSTTIRALVPTGGHVGHGNDLTVVRNRKGKGGRRPGLEHYSKAFALPNASGAAKKVKGFTPRGGKIAPIANPSAQVQRSLQLATNPKVGNVSRVAPQKFSAATPRLNGNIPSGNRRGSAL